VRSLRLVLAAAFVAACVTAPSAPAAVAGEQRVLIVLITWGAEPYSQESARTALDETAAFVRSASFGQTWIVGEVTPWLHALPAAPRDCDLDTIHSRGLAAAAQAGFPAVRYTRIVFAFPEIPCPWGGAYFAGHIQVNGRIDRHLLAHELGHTYGVSEEGPSWICNGGSCATQPYGSPYSVMGHGLGDFNAFEKAAYGWIETRVVDRNGAHPLGPIDRPSATPQAIRVLTAADEYWFEYRPSDPAWGWDTPGEATPGVVIYGGVSPALPDISSRFPERNLLLADPLRLGRPSVIAGETYSVPGAFSLSVDTLGLDAEVRFAWTDRTPPAAPRIVSPSARTRSRSPLAEWRGARETGSGVREYLVRVDRRPVRRVPAVTWLGELPALFTPQLRLGRLPLGRHRLSIVAVDRAGNRSRAAVRVFDVVR
jgi:hypothetical protein